METRPWRTNTRRFVIVYFQRIVSTKAQTTVTTATIPTTTSVTIAEKSAQMQTTRARIVSSTPGTRIAIRPRHDGRPDQISRSSSAATATAGR